jgi:hypothetical protein
MTTYRMPATYVWDGSKWVLSLVYWSEGNWWYLQNTFYSADGTNWTQGNT